MNLLICSILTGTVLRAVYSGELIQSKPGFVKLCAKKEIYAHSTFYLFE